MKEKEGERPKFNWFISIVATLLVLAGCGVIGLLIGFIYARLTQR